MKSTPPKQKRSRETEQRLLSAAEGLIAEVGLSGLSIAEVVRRAGSSVGSFYGRFGDKDGLLRALHLRRIEGILVTLEEMGGAMASIDRGTATLMCMTQVVGHYREHGPLMAAFSARAAVDPVGWASTVEAHTRLVKQLAALLGQANGEPVPQRTLELGLHMVFSFLGDLAVYGQAGVGFAPFTHDELPGELSRMLSGYWSAAAS